MTEITKCAKRIDMLRDMHNSIASRNLNLSTTLEDATSAMSQIQTILQELDDALLPTASKLQLKKNIVDPVSGLSRYGTAAIAKIDKLDQDSLQLRQETELLRNRVCAILEEKKQIESLELQQRTGGGGQDEIGTEILGDPECSARQALEQLAQKAVEEAAAAEAERLLLHKVTLEYYKLSSTVP